MKNRKRLIGILVAAAVFVAVVLVVIFAVIRPLGAQKEKSETALAALQNSTPAPTEAPTPTPEPTPLPPWRLMTLRLYDSGNHLVRADEYDPDGRHLGEIDEEGLHWTYAYDDAGRIIKSVETRSDGSTVQRTEYRYDAEGRELDELRYLYKPTMDGEEDYLHDRSSSQYDEHGNVLHSETSNKIEGLYEWEDYTYTYDEAGRVLKSVCIHTHISDGSYTETVTNRYDEKGNLVEYTEKVASKMEFVDSYNSRELYEYDENGRIIKRTEYYQGRLSSYATREYDENGVQRRLSSYDADGSLNFTTEYDENGEVIDPDVRLEYDEEGRVIREYNDRDSFAWRGEYRYDELGRLVRIDHYKTDDDKDYNGYTEYEYLY